MGFIVAWNLWLFAILNMTNVGLQFTQYLGYIFGPRVAAFAAQTWVIVRDDGGRRRRAGVDHDRRTADREVGAHRRRHADARDVRDGHRAAVAQRRRGTLAEYHPLHTATPVISLLSLNLLGKMGFGAFAGFEYVAIHAGECRDPVRSITRATIIAAPIIVVMFVLGTSSVLGDDPDRRDRPHRADSAAAHAWASGRSAPWRPIVPITLSAMLAIRFAQASVNFAGSTRLPMVAGWDNLLPAWFTRLSARYRTPVNSILFVGAATFVLSIARARRRRQAGGVSAALELRRDLLRAHISRDVRRAARRARRAGGRARGG